MHEMIIPDSIVSLRDGEESKSTNHDPVGQELAWEGLQLVKYNDQAELKEDGHRLTILDLEDEANHHQEQHEHIHSNE